MQDLDVSITICSWNTVNDLRDCLASLRTVQSEAKFEVIVVDNASVDGSPEMVTQEFPEVRLLAQTTNLGFTGGHNLAVRERQGKDAFLLNSDTVVHAGALASLLTFRRDHPEVGILGPKLLNPDGSLQLSCRRFPNPFAALFRNTIFGRLFPNNRFTRDYLMTDWPHDQARSVDWVSGAAMWVTKETIDRIGLFDEDFFMYCEDVDLCWRAHEAGLDVVYVPFGSITHAIGRSTDRVANRMIIQFHRSMFRFYRKNMVSRAFLPARPFLLAFAALGLTLRASLFLIKNGFDELRRRILKR
ncbi:MAG: N-acetylglucosaminyl-diphospho-decaprenol L-rhamnosyltransferase [Fimbriimonadaceae bacterium]|nr:N-acetylglucosaminyl-diphospho-decaprenol L-rhamnosyltransferase [Fimbriimonadaceae bacterium]